MSLKSVAVLVVASLLLSDVRAPADDPAPAEPQKVALLVGVNEYLKPGFKALQFAEADVTAVGVELEKLGFEVTILLGSAEGKAKATRANIEAAARRMVEPLGQNDIALVMLSGHGQQLNPNPDPSQPNVAFNTSESYYCPVDALVNRPESQFSLSLLMDEILAPNVGRKLLLVDACRDVPVDAARGARNTKGIEGRIVALPEDTGVFFSCRAGQMSFEREELGHGLFTYCVLEGLREKAVVDGEIAWSSLVAYVDRRMQQPDLTRFMPASLKQVPIPAGAMPYTVLGHVTTSQAAPLGTPSLVRPRTIAIPQKPSNPVPSTNRVPADIPPIPVTGDIEELKVLADEAYRAGRYAEAIRILNAVLDRKPKDDVALYLRGSALVEQGTSEANAAIVRAGISDSRAAIGIVANIDYYLPYLAGMAELTIIENRPMHATQGLVELESVLTKGRPTSEQRANLIFQRSRLHHALGHDVAAREDLNSVIEVVPDHLAAHSALTNLASRSDSPEAVERLHDAAVAAIPTEPLVYHNRSTFLASQGRVDDALRDLGRALQLDPGYVPSLVNRGFVNVVHQQRYADSVSDLTEAISRDPSNSLAYSLRAMARLHLGDIDAAIADYRSVVTLAPESAASHYDLGFALFSARDYSSADHAFQQALLIDPTIEFLVPWRYCAMVFTGDRDAALELFGNIELKPQNQRKWFDLLTLYVMGSLDEEALFAAIDGTDPTKRALQECEANYFAGLRNSSRNELARAEEFFEKVLDCDQHHLAAFRAARYALGRFAEE
jgi:tetratricopeptide (TPR) repeat protein